MTGDTAPATRLGRAEREPGILAECRDVARTYGKGPTAVVAVHGITCRIRPGLRLAVTGPSGSGKSTLLHLLAGIDRPTAGTVEWPDLRDRATEVGVVFQGPSLLPALDVTENVALPLLLAGQPEDEAFRRARSALGRLAIGDLGGKLADELSGGQAQRVAVARVLAARPLLIVADEPTGQLDHESAERVMTVLAATADELGAALVVATHDPFVAARLGQEWTMRDGRLHGAADPGLAGRNGEAR
ncbi:MAG TPA: ABC transporter ATP-binding protein [Amycolatopsis sp.]|nr:ABC transporter ATP-binding protein [Amycolatopsis sp.]